MPITLKVNGADHALDIEPDTKLLYALRGELGLNGAKYGCGLGQCGACRVLVDGDAAWSCQLAVGDLGGAEITTLEGLRGRDGGPHPLIGAFVTEQAAQCGYCIPGMIVSAAALLRRNPEPGEGEIRAELEGQLCRCGTHNRILRAVQRAVREG